jgi:hypothetical protein
MRKAVKVRKAIKVPKAIKVEAVLASQQADGKLNYTGRTMPRSP